MSDTMITRQALKTVQSRLRRYPAVVLVGPRQSGKTTLAQTLSNVYYDLEQDSDRLRLNLQWDSVIKDKRLIILDEAQTHPDIFRRLRGAIDSDRKRCGRFLLLGSVSPQLMTQVSESLAGRLAIVELTPLLLKELAARTTEDELWLRGGYPDGGVLDGRSHLDWRKNYLSLLTQRDLPNWGLPAPSKVTDRLLSMLAVSHGNQWNASRIARSLGHSYHTINNYLDYLDGAFLIRRLLPFHGNIRKRLVKSPKVYWRDSGLLHALMNVADFDDLLNQPWVGASWEGFVIEQILGALTTADTPHDAWYFRTGDGHEIDFVLKTGGKLWAVEITLTTTPSPEAFQRLEKTADLIGADKRVLVSRQREFLESDDRIACDLTGFLDRAMQEARNHA